MIILIEAQTYQTATEKKECMDFTLNLSYQIFVSQSVHWSLIVLN